MDCTFGLHYTLQERFVSIQPVCRCVYIDDGKRGRHLVTVDNGDTIDRHTTSVGDVISGLF